MNKELIDHVWKHCLPKEFKEEVKKIYYNFLIKSTISQYDSGIMETLVSLFGIHNLTSDAEGEDEMLYVSRKEVIRNFKEQVAWKNHHQSSQHDRDIAMGWCNALQFLFGSKCLPDEDSSNVEKLEKNGEVEPKPAEPKYRKGDKVLYKGRVKVVISEMMPNRYYRIALPNNQSPICKHESDLEPYTEPNTKPFKVGDKVRYKEVYTIEDIEKDGIALVDSDFLVDPEDLELYEESKEDKAEEIAEKAIKPVEKYFDSILKDSFAKERRLNIAAMVMQGIMANPNPQMVEMDVHRVADLAILMADTLIAECGKGDKK